MPRSFYDFYFEPPSTPRAPRIFLFTIHHRGHGGRRGFFLIPVVSMESTAIARRHFGESCEKECSGFPFIINLCVFLSCKVLCVFSVKQWFSLCTLSSLWFWFSWRSWRPWRLEEKENRNPLSVKNRTGDRSERCEYQKEGAENFTAIIRRLCRLNP